MRGKREIILVILLILLFLRSNKKYFQKIDVFEYMKNYYITFSKHLYNFFIDFKNILNF